MSDFISTTVRVPVSALQEKARLLRRYADDYGDTFDRIRNAMDALRENGQWVGASQEAAAFATEQNQQKYVDTVNRLNKLAGFLQSFVDAIEQKDEDIKRQIHRAAPQLDAPEYHDTKVSGGTTYWVK